MAAPQLNSLLLSSTDPQRLRQWYVAALQPDENADVENYGVLRFGSVYLMIDTRTDISDKSPEPGRIILNFDVDDARAVVERMNSLGVTWLAELDDRDGSLFATAIDPDGNYVQLIQISEAHRNAMGG
ncbi:VOC family protein [Nonomuraea sp. NPDC050310]|uniref:VOC family protein n=1 Tax=Nonomuraea sp. NPDC050310 TaxID=3154935 RepID=UPI0033F46656